MSIRSAGIASVARSGHSISATVPSGNGDSPISWASWHLRPGSVLALLAYGPHHIGPNHVAHYTGDHGQGWGGMEAHVLGDYRPIGR